MSYYAKRLNAKKLEQCYLLAPARVKQYLDAEIDYAASFLTPKSQVLELGCGTGRILFHLADKAKTLTGIDISPDNIAYAQKKNPFPHIRFEVMDATDLQFEDRTFDLTICLQNGICAFHADQTRLVTEALRVTRSCGNVIFSSYTQTFWPHRLKWFEIQAENGLLGEIDYKKSINNTIVCKDGFSSGAMTREDFQILTKGLGCKTQIRAIDDSSLICRIKKMM